MIWSLIRNRFYNSHRIRSHVTEQKPHHFQISQTTISQTQRSLLAAIQYCLLFELLCYATKIILIMIFISRLLRTKTLAFQN